MTRCERKVLRRLSPLVGLVNAKWMEGSLQHEFFWTDRALTRSLRSLPGLLLPSAGSPFGNRPTRGLCVLAIAGQASVLDAGEEHGGSSKRGGSREGFLKQGGGCCYMLVIAGFSPIFSEDDRG